MIELQGVLKIFGSRNVLECNCNRMVGIRENFSRGRKKHSAKGMQNLSEEK